MRLRFRSAFLRRQVEAELDEELRYHLDREIEANLAAGMSESEARFAALRAAGGLEQRKEECRDMRGMNLVDNLVQDIRFGIRQLRKNPGFTATSILTLSLGMCACVAIFAFVDATLISPLPYQDSNRLVGVFETVEMFPLSNLSYLDYLDWKKSNTVFRSLDVYQRSGFILNTPEGAEPARGAEVSAGFFRTLGVSPVLGRDFYTGEDLPSAPRTAILSHAAWQKRYGGRPEAVGRTVTLNGEAVTIIGVLPGGFHFSPVEPSEFFLTMHATGSCKLRRSCHNIYGVARLKDGVTVQSALLEMKGIAKQLEQQYPDSNRGQGAAVVPLSEVIVGEVRPILLLLLSGAGLLLLIAVVNISSLLLVRSESRSREMAVRTALGAGNIRLMRQFVTEGLMLVVAGGALGIVWAAWSMQLLLKLIPTDLLAGMSFLQGLGLNIRVMSFASLILLLAAVLFSVTPMLRLSAASVHAGLAEGSRGSAGMLWRRLGTKLVMAELAVAMVLLVGAGLLGRSMYSLLHLDLGFQPDHLVGMQLAASSKTYSNDELVIALHRRILSHMESLPGVQSAGITSSLPVSGNGNTMWFRVLGRPWNGEHNETPQREVSASYFKTIGARLLKGRYFTEADDATKPRVGIVNSAFVRKYFPGEAALGQRLTYISKTVTPIEIVGIVDDIKEGPLDVATPQVLYVPAPQDTNTYFSVVVRSTQSEQTLVPLMAAELRKLDAGIVARNGEAMVDRINDSPSAYLHRSSAWLVGGFAALALVLSVVGLYGVIAYSVSQRTREIGVRMALGAQPGTVYKLILGDAGWLTVGGIVIGLACSVGAAALMRGLLFGVRPWDVPTLAGVAILLGLCALLASYLPAKRAASVNPVDALRAE
jgi:predicted permease